MKKSDILSKNSIKNPISNSDNNIVLIYKQNKKLINNTGKLKQKYNLNNEELIKIIKENIPVPVSIFKNNSPLEALVKYLKENIGLSLQEISKLLNRDPRTIWITYNNSKDLTLDVSSKIKVPVEIFSDRKYSVFENLVDYLVQEEKLELSKIAKLVSRDYKTIWTFYKRAKVKSNA